MINVLKAIYSELIGSSLAGSTYCGNRIYYGIAPQNTTANSTSGSFVTFPFIIYNKISEEMDFTQINTLETYLLQIDLYDSNTSAESVETMAGILDELFNLMLSDFTITGYSLVYIKKRMGNTIRTLDNNWRHISRYEIQIQQN